MPLRRFFCPVFPQFFEDQYMNPRMELLNSLRWDVDSSISTETCENILQASRLFSLWVSGANESDEKVLSIIQYVHWKPSSTLWRMIGFHHVELSTVFIDPRGLTVETALHELAHVLDNRHGPHPLASIFGGGPSDDMLRYIGLEPDQFFPRFSAPGYEKVLVDAGCELNPTEYGRLKGPAEDFAEGFRLAVLDPKLMKDKAPKRLAWFTQWRETL
jgi:hypothetical protein